MGTDEEAGGWDKSSRTHGMAMGLWLLSLLAASSSSQCSPGAVVGWSQGGRHVPSPARSITCSHHTDTTTHPHGPDGFSLSQTRVQKAHI